MKTKFFAIIAATLLSVPALAQATYTYTGNPFTLFSCGASNPGPGDILCSTPGPNSFTSYTASNSVTATLTLANPLPANMSFQDVSSMAGFQLTLNDGQHTVTNAMAVGMFAQVATDANGNISAWHLVVNTGGLQNGGIATSNFTDSSGSHVFDSGTLACCDPTVPGNLAENFGIPGTWSSSSGTQTPSALVNNILQLVSDPLLQLTAGQTNSFTDKLNNVLASIQAGQNKQAINQLNSFISSVQTALKNGKISAQSATTLINAANAAIASLSS